MIDQQVAKFIETHIDLIENNDFRELYLETYQDEDVFFPTNIVTRMLWDAGIDPLSYMKEIPIQFLWGDKDVQEFTCPDHIQTIASYAFNCCSNLHTFVVNTGCMIINERAFSGCDSLQYIIIPNSVGWIHPSAFDVINKKKFFIVCNPDSYAQDYANKEGYKTITMEVYHEHISHS